MKLVNKKNLSIWNAFLTELKAIFRDKAVFSTFVSTALVVMVVYTYVYSKQVVREVPVAVIDLDQSRSSRDYLQMLAATEEVTLKKDFLGLNQAKSAFFKGDVKGVVLIPENFSSDIRRGRLVNVSVYADASYMLYYRQIMGAVNVVNGYYNAGVDVKKLMSAGNTAKQAQVIHSPVTVSSISVYNPVSGYGSYIIPMVTALITQLVVLIAIGILGGTRRENMELHFLFAGVLTPGGTIPVLLGKGLVYIFLYFFILLLQTGIIYPLFGIPFRGAFWDMLLFMLPYILAVVFLGIALTGLFRRREDAIMVLIFTTMPFMMLSGLSYPIESFPVFYQYLAKILPSSWGIKGFVKITQMGVSIKDVMEEWIALWVLAGVYFTAAVFFLKQTARKSLNDSLAEKV